MKVSIPVNPLWLLALLSAELHAAAIVRDFQIFKRRQNRIGFCQFMAFTVLYSLPELFVVVVVVFCLRTRSDLRHLALFNVRHLGAPNSLLILYLTK